jgi:hypothetical protein
MSMLRQFEVTFSVYTDSRKNVGIPNMVAVKTIVAAGSPSQACRIIESMHGGPNVVSTYSAVEQR